MSNEPAISIFDMIQLVNQRIAAAKEPVCAQHVARGQFGVEEIRCKCCGTQLRTLMPDDRFAEQRMLNGKMVWVERLMLGTLAPYNEIMVYFDDGSRHVTLLCGDCAQKITNDDLEWMYCADLKEWMTDSTPDDVIFWMQQLRRNPISFKVFAPGTVANN